MEETIQSQQDKQTITAVDTAAEEAADAFARNGKAIVKSGMSLLLERLRCAKKHDARIWEAISLIEDAPELRAQQKKELIEALKSAAVMDTEKVLALVTDILERLQAADSSQAVPSADKEVVVTLEKQVKKWAQ